MSCEFGSGSNGELTFIDLISIISFYVGLKNLDLNIDQNALDKQTKDLDAQLRKVVDEIHEHLNAQDKKINSIINKLGVKNNEDNQEIIRTHNG